MWVAGDVVRDAQASQDGRRVQHLVSLVSVEDDAPGEELEVVWEIEPGTRVIERAELPPIGADRLDEPAERSGHFSALGRHCAPLLASSRGLRPRAAAPAEGLVHPYGSLRPVPATRHTNIACAEPSRCRHRMARASAKSASPFVAEGSSTPTKSEQSLVARRS
jgi:hypothetical protein